MIILSKTLSLVDAAGLKIDHPLVGWHNVVSSGDFAATSENVDFPVTNLANPNTSLLWKSEVTTDQYVTLSVSYPDLVDYIAIARHNFGSGLIVVSVEIFVEDEWVILVEEVLLPDDRPVIFRFSPRVVESVRVRLQPQNNPDGDKTIPRAAVLYIGQLLVMQRRLYVGHTPINYGSRTRVANNRSENGQFLGRIVLGETYHTSADFSNLTPDWVRNQLNPFLINARENPFFFAWRPDGYPREVGFAWLIGDPSPVNQRPNGMMQVRFEMEGVV